MKYSINNAGRIVAERDIYSLGGFIPKGRLGGFIADKTQLSQEGECWLAGGDISGRPDIRIKDNAYLGDFVGATGIHTDGVTEFSGNTLIPGKIVVRNLVADAKNNVFVKDSFIGVSMDVLCGPATTTTAFPFEQGDFRAEAAKGTLFTSASIRLDDTSACRNTVTLRLGRNTYLYIPAGYRARVFWAYYDVTNQLAYSGESKVVAAGLTKLDHSVYRSAMVVIVKADGTAMTPANLLATGAKILGHINSSVNVDIRPESASGQYVMDKSSFLMNTDNFGLATTQLRRLAGSMYDTNMYTPGGSTDYKIYGTFHNVQRLEYAKYLSDSHRTNVNRDTYISAYDCPLLRVDGTTYNDALAAKGDLTLRGCIVPKAEFRNDIINGNTYEDIDFSYANEDLGFTMAGYARFVSSHKQGIYRLDGGSNPLGFASHKGNLADTSILYQAEERIPLDGDIIEQGTFESGGAGSYYESAKSDSDIRIRTWKPLATFGLVFPSLPAGYSVKAFYYLDEDFVVRSRVIEPTEIVTTYPYVVIAFKKDDDSVLTASEFIALNTTLRITDYTKAPEITGSAYVGAGCTVRGDVKLIGDPYVNRVFDVNMWERGGVAFSTGKQWLEMKDGSNPSIRMSSKHIYPVSPGDTISLTGPYRLGIVYFNADKKAVHDTGWGTGTFTAPDGCFYMGLSFSSSPDGKFIDFSDIPLANVKYVRAFKKRRYITNELDRTSPEDILLKPGDFGNYYVGRTPGETYDSKKGHDANYLALLRPVNVPGIGATINRAVGFTPSYGSLDALTKFINTDLSLIPNTVFFGGGFGKSPAAAILPSEAPDARFIIEFTPTPRIIVPYGSSTLFISGPKIRMYDNAVLSRNFNHDADIVLQGDAVMGYDFSSGDCLCSNGHDDAIIKRP